MSNPLKKKVCKNNVAKSQLSKTQQSSLIQSLTSTASSYISQFVVYVKGFLLNKQLTANNLQTQINDSLRGLLSKAEEQIKNVYENIIREIKILQKNEVQACKHYSKEELARFETKLEEYSIKLEKFLEEILKCLNDLKGELQTKIISRKEIQNLITYIDEKIYQTKKLTQEMIKNIQQIIEDPELIKRLMATLNNYHEKIKYVKDTLCIATKEVSSDGRYKTMNSELATRKSLKFIATSYISQIVVYMKNLVSANIPHGQSERPISQDLKTLLTATEIKVKELYDGILNKVKNIQDNELKTYQNYSKEELVKAKFILQEYSTKIQKLSDELVKRIITLKNELQKQIMTQKDLQNFVSYFDNKIIETKKLTEDLIKNIEATVKKSTLGKNLKEIIENNSDKIKVAIDHLHIAIKNNIAKIGHFKPLTDTKAILLKIPTFGKVKPLTSSLSARTLSSNNKASTDCGKNATVDANKEKLSFFNFTKHFNSKTIHGRANVAKVTYAGILIYYIYKKVKNSTN